MALQITELVSKEAFQQLTNLDIQLKAIRDTYKRIGSELAINVKVNISDKEGLANLTKTITSNFKQMEDAEKKVTKSTKDLESILRKEAETIKEAKQQNKDLGKIRGEVNTKTKEGQKIIGDINKKMKENTDLVKKNSDAYTKQKMGIGSYFSSMLKGLTVFELMIKGIEKLGEALHSTFQNIVQFESANARLSAITGESAKGMKELENQAMYLGKTTRYTASEITALQTELAKLGFVKDGIIAMTEGIYKFGLATGGSMADSASLTGAMLRSFNATAQETDRYVSAMAVSTTKSALSFGYLQNALPIVSGAMSTMGWSIEDVLALMGKLADSGMSASIASTALRNIFLHLSDTSSAMYKKFGKVENLEQFTKKLAELKAEGADLADVLELTDKRSAVPFANLVNHADDVLKLKESITGVGEELDKMADKINNTAEGSTYRLKSAWESLALAFYESKGVIAEVIDALATAVRGMANFFRTYQQIYGLKKAEVLGQYEDIENQSIAVYKIVDKITQRVKYIRKEDFNVNDYRDKKWEVSSMPTTERELPILREYQRNLNDGLKEEEARRKAINTQIAIQRENARGNYEARDKTEEELKKWQKYLDKNPLSVSANREVERLTSLLAKENAKAESIINTMKFYQNWTPEQPAPTGGVIGKDDKKGGRDRSKDLLNQELQLEKLVDQAKIGIAEDSEEKKLMRLEKKYNDYLRQIEKMDLISAEKKQMAIVLLEQARETEEAKVHQDFVNKRNVFDATNTLATSKRNLQAREMAERNLLDMQEKAELEQAERLGASVSIVREKYRAKRYELDSKYFKAYADIAMKNNENELAITESGTERKAKLLEENLYWQEQIEIDNAIATGESVEKIQLKYAKKIADAKVQIENELLQKKLDANTNYANMEYAELHKRYQEGKIDKEMYERDMANIAYKSTRDQLTATITSLQKELELVGDNADSEFEIRKKLNQAIADLNKLDAENAKNNFKAVIAVMEKWSDQLLDTFNAIGSYIKQMYQNQIDQLDEESDAEDEKYDRDVERIEKLEEIGAISSEEAEARKRSAKDKTEQKQKAIQKQQQEIAYKQAVWEKAMSASQTAINTALAIMRIWAGEGTIATRIAMTALVSAIGTAQLATILATPIPKYAKGTEGHKGGLAVVGDGGRSEFVMYAGHGWVTPSTSTLVDLPKGAVVYPDYSKVAMGLPIRDENGNVKVINDYKALEKKQGRTNSLMVNLIREVRKGNESYANYKQSIW